MQGSGEFFRQWSDWVLTLATRNFPQLPDLHAQAIPRLCYGAEDKDSEEEPQGTSEGRSSREIQDLQSRLKDSEYFRAAVEGRSPPACYKWEK